MMKFMQVVAVALLVGAAAAASSSGSGSGSAAAGSEAGSASASAVGGFQANCHTCCDAERRQFGTTISGTQVMRADVVHLDGPFVRYADIT